VLPVYEPIVPYLRRLGVKRYEVAYNVVAGRHLRVKDDYGLHEPVRVISVGRLFEAKNPINLIHAVEELPGVELLVVGDGPLRQELQRQAGARVRFAPAIPNAELCGLLADHDERERLGRRARVEAQERWALERTERRYAEIYERLLEERGRVLSSA
jgi:glycosyltransferase involved in cell wall biosynthesis